MSSWNREYLESLIAKGNHILETFPPDQFISRMSIGNKNRELEDDLAVLLEESGEVVSDLWRETPAQTERRRLETAIDRRKRLLEAMPPEYEGDRIGLESEIRHLNKKLAALPAEEARESKSMPFPVQRSEPGHSPLMKVH